MLAIFWFSATLSFTFLYLFLHLLFITTLGPHFYTNYWFFFTFQTLNLLTKSIFNIKIWLRSSRKNETRQYQRSHPRERHQHPTSINPQTKVHEKHGAKENIWTPDQEQFGIGFEKTLAFKNLSQWHSVNLQGAHMAATSQKQSWNYTKVLLKFTQESPEIEQLNNGSKQEWRASRTATEQVKVIRLCTIATDKHEPAKDFKMARYHQAGHSPHFFITKNISIVGSSKLQTTHKTRGKFRVGRKRAI